MEVSPFGVLFAALAAGAALAGIAGGGRACARPAAAMLGVALPLQATAFATLGWAGGASVLIATVAAAAFVAAAGIGALREALCGGRLAVTVPAATLVAFAALAVAGGWALPRIFAGQTLVFPLDRTVEGVTGGALKLPLAPLTPSAGAVTQGLYLVSSTAAFLAALWAATRDRRLLPAALWAATITQGAVAALDAAGWEGMALLRTANYQIAPEQAFAGFTRLVGASTEPSQFGLLSAALAAWHLWRWREGRGARNGIAALAMAGLAVGSLSTTALATLLFVAAWFASGVLARPRGPGLLALVCLGGALLTGLAGWAALGPAAPAIGGAVDALFAGKLASESGIERAAWAAQALVNFRETWGLGAGLGAAKASGWATAVLGQTGVPGAALMLVFLVAVLAPPTADRAARAVAVAALFGALLSEARVDLGYLLFLAAGAAAASHRRSDAPAPIPLDPAWRPAHA